MSEKSTPLDQEVMHHILACEFRFGRMPTMKELCFYLNMSHGQLQRHLKRLADNGKLLPLPLGTIHYAIIDPTKATEISPIAEEIEVGEAAE